MACESPGNVRWWVLVDKDDWTAHSKLAYNSLIAERRLKNQIKISLLYIRPERHVSIPSKYCTVYTGLWIWIWICMDPQKLKNNNKKNARKLVKNCNCIHIFKVNLYQRHDFLLLSNLFCFFNYSNLVIFYKVFFYAGSGSAKKWMRIHSPAYDTLSVILFLLCLFFITCFTFKFGKAAKAVDRTLPQIFFLRALSVFTTQGNLTKQKIQFLDLKIRLYST